MSEYGNVAAGKLRLKGEPLAVKGSAGGISKKKKHSKKKNHSRNYSSTGGNTVLSRDPAEIIAETGKDDEEGLAVRLDEYLTPAERKYLQQWEKIDHQRLNKMASKSHRDRIQELNQYLANLSEHYDIPKVGPG